MLAGLTDHFPHSRSSTTLSRRTFVRGSALAAAFSAATLLFGAKWQAASFAPSPWQLLEQLDQATFTTYIGQNFSVEVTPQESVELQLLELTDLGRDAHQRGESFSLLWAGMHPQPLAQETYLFSHPQVGAFPIFIVPLATIVHPPQHASSAPSDLASHLSSQAPPRQLYQAIFNRLVV